MRVIPFHRLQGAPIRTWGRIIERFNRSGRVAPGVRASNALSPLRNGVEGPMGVLGASMDPPRSSSGL